MANSTITHLTTNWKTTLAGFLNTFCGMAAAGAFAPNPFINTKVSGILLAIAGIGNIWLHITMIDGKQTTINVPAGATGTVVNVPPASTTTTVENPQVTKP